MCSEVGRERGHAYLRNGKLGFCALAWDLELGSDVRVRTHFPDSCPTLMPLRGPHDSSSSFSLELTWLCLLLGQCDITVYKHVCGGHLCVYVCMYIYSPHLWKLWPKRSIVLNTYSIIWHVLKHFSVITKTLIWSHQQIPKKLIGCTDKLEESWG